MNIDKSSLVQLDIFNPQSGDDSLFAQLNFTLSSGGRKMLENRFYNPLRSKEEIADSIRLLKILHGHLTDWNGDINNGVAFMVEKYLDNPLTLDSRGTWLQGVMMPIIYKSDFQMIKYSIQKVQIFLKGMQRIMEKWQSIETIPIWKSIIADIQHQFEKYPVFAAITANQKLRNSDILAFDFQLRRNQYKGLISLLDDFYSMDMWFSLCQIQDLEGYHYPEVRDEKILELRDFFHPMLTDAVSYSIDFHEDNFLFLTGANMAGKSTFIRAIGTVVYLAHLGIAVPAREMRFGYFDGISCSITVTDNLLEGESYFYNEVQRINEIIQKIESNERWLVLMDELFKGTNYKDALECTESIVRGLLKYKNSYFVLTTHLYQLAQDLEGTDGIMFKYFETLYDPDDNYKFTYHLRQGVSEDTIGYKILKNSGVLKKLDSI